MITKEVSQIDADGYFISVTVADESPLEPGVFLIPYGAIDFLAPVVPEGQRAKWVGEWVFEDILQIKSEPEPVSSQEQASMQRHVAYINESDPLFFKVQRGEATQEKWLAKIEEIKQRYPKS